MCELSIANRLLFWMLFLLWLVGLSVVLTLGQYVKLQMTVLLEYFHKSQQSKRRGLEILVSTLQLVRGVVVCWDYIDVFYF